MKNLLVNPMTRQREINSPLLHFKINWNKKLVHLQTIIFYLLELIKKKNHLFTRITLIVGIVFWLIHISFSQACPVTACLAAHQTFVDLSSVPLCGSGTLALDGDVQSNQPDCKNVNLNCHEFIVYRAPNSLTQQFNVKVGQGSGCTGELDASYAYINGVCYQLSNGGSSTVITFSFPYGTDTVHLYFCINSGAHISICNICRLPPPCTQLPLCNLSDISITGCQSNIPAAETNPANVFTNTGTCTQLYLSHIDVGDTDFCASPPGVDFIRTYYLKFIDTNGDTIDFRQCAQHIQITPSQFTFGITCPSNISIQCDESTNPTHTGTASATDNCGGSPTVTYSDVTIASVDCPNAYTLNRTWGATGSCANSSTCLQVINVIDNTPPAMTCLPNITVQCASLVPSPDPSGVTTTDNCGGSNTITFVEDAISNQTCVNRFTITRTYRATDVCGNSATCNQVITVFDTIPPPITCPDNVTVQCANEVPAPNDPTTGAMDNCEGISTISFLADVISNETCNNRFTITRTYTAMDECGNSSTCNQTITVFDDTAPAIVCPADTTVQCANLVPTPNDPSPGLADNCGGISTVTFIEDVISNLTCANRYIITRTYRAIDECGNSSTCNQIITVFDNIEPSITCPADVSVQCASDVPPSNTESVITSDNCGGTATVAYIGDVISNQACPNRYTVTRTYQATDECGNTSTCNQTITVFDDTPPVCMTQNITISIDHESGHTDITPEQIDNGSSDNCGPVTLGLDQTSFSCDNDGINIVTLTVTDQCNNTSTCTATVTVLYCYNPCITIVACVYLQGAAVSPNGTETYTIPMRTSLNTLRVLPGQTYVDPFLGTPHYTPAGEPYCSPPWNYCGTEGASFNTFGIPGNAGYPSTVVDWVLVSIRADSSGNGGPLCQAAALLHNDGHLQFVQPFNCCDLNFDLSYYLVIEHRNHLIVMSHQKVPIVPGFVESTLTYSFCTQQSYEDPNFAGFDLFARQKEIIPGSFAMYAGNGEQSNSNASDTEINVNDLSTWLGQNGSFGDYRLGDYNLNGDTNLNDRTVWERNNGRATSVPRLP